MKENLEKNILRIGLSLVILWFGVSQLISPQNWVGYVPLWIDSFISATTIVYMNGVFEVIASIFLLSNKFVKLVSLLISIHLGIIIIELGYNATAIRDIGILIGFLALIAIEKEKKLLNS